MTDASRIEVMLSTLNAAEVGSVETVCEKLREVERELLSLDQAELAARAAEAIAALSQGNIAEFKRGRAFLQSKIGHLRP